MIQLIIKDIPDPYVVENFVRIQDFVAREAILGAGFTFFEVGFTAAVTNFRFKHNMGLLPKDIIVTAKTGSGTVTFNYDRFTNTYLDITTSAATTIRFLAGSIG